MEPFAAAVEAMERGGAVAASCVVKLASLRVVRKNPEELAEVIAKNERIDEMTPEHWDIVNLAREFFHDNGVVAEPRAFSKLMKTRYGKDRSDQKYIYSLFPTGLIKCANKVAGLPRPKGCS